MFTGRFQARHALRQKIIWLIGFGLCLYSAYHLIQGERGLTNFISLNREKALALKTHAVLEAERIALEEKVKKLRPDSLDTDLLEERARHVLGYIHPDDITIISEPPAEEATP